MKLVQIKENDLEVLEKLLQLYLHDISFYFPIDFNNDEGLYLYDDLNKYFNNTVNYGYFIYFNNNIAGFILIETNANENIIQEMFILNHFKNKGIGKLAIYDLLDKHKGSWIIKSLPNSEPSERFWTKTIKDYTNNNYNIEHVGKYKRAVFTFNIL